MDTDMAFPQSLYHYTSRTKSRP